MPMEYGFHVWLCGELARGSVGVWRQARKVVPGSSFELGVGQVLLADECDAIVRTKDCVHTMCHGGDGDMGQSGSSLVRRVGV